MNEIFRQNYSSKSEQNARVESQKTTSISQGARLNGHI